MVFLQRKRPPQPPPPPSPPNPPPRAPRATRTATPDDASSSSAVDDAAALLAEAGCTLLVPLHQPPALPSPLSFAPRLARALAAADAALRDRLLAGLAAFAESPARLRQLLLPTSAAHSPSLARALLSVPALQPGLLGLLLDKLPEHFDNVLDGMPLHDDVGRLIVAQFRWLDFLVDADAFVAKLMEVLSVAPPRLKKEIIGSLPEIIGDQCHATVVAALEKLLQEDSEVVVSALDALSDLNLSEQLQEQAVTVAISCIRTVHADQMPHLLRFLLLSATPFNAGRIISQIRKQLKFVSTVDPRAARGKKLKGKASANGTDGAILDALRSGLRFKNMLCEAFLKELKSVDNPRDHKVIDVWLIMLIYGNGGALQKSAEKILKSKILQLCIRETLFDQCIRGNTELVKLIGSLIAHIGSGVSLEVSSALDIMISLTSDKPEELIPLSSHITGSVHSSILLGILDYLESFHEDNLRKVYEIFCHLALAAGFNTGSGGSSVANELLMVVRKQVSNPDMKYRRMGIIGALRIVSTIADVNASMNCSSSQIERLGNQGSLGGINAVLGCPLHLPSTKLNAFSTQVATRVDNVSQRARNETAVKLLMRLRNLILLEGLLNAYLKIHPLSLPDLRYVGDHGSTSTSKFNLPKNMGDQNMEGNVSNKRQKGHKDKASSEKSNSDEKFKQPTILDAFKRAGVTISQETNRDSQPSPSGMMSRVTEHETNNPCKFGIVDLMAAPAQLDMQRFKFRTLHATCLSLLNYSEMPLYVYLLRELQNKLDNLYPSSKPFFSSSQGKSTQAYCQKSMEEFLNKIQPLFSSVRKHLDGAVSMIKDGSDSCPDNWNSHSASAGNPDIPYVVVLKSSVATSVFKEVLGCYRKLLGIPDLLNQANISVLKELLQTFQPSENFDEVLAEFRPSLVPSNLDYLYCGAYTMFAAILDIVCSFSYLLAYDVLITMQSVLNSVIMLFEKSGEQNGKNLHMGCSKEIIPFLRKHLGLSARKLLTSDLPSEDAENGWQSKGDLIQKILQIYLKNSDSTSDLLDELACSVLPKVPSFKTGSTQDMSHGFPTLCASTILSWYRVVGHKRTMITSKIPVAKRSLERFVFQVKALLHNCSTEETFWMGTYILCTPNFCSWQRREIYIDGRHCCSNLLNRCMTGNLRHKDLQGQLVSSQVYGSVDDSPNDEQEQMETDPETPADENANAMDEDAAEDSNEAPLEE
uniref:Fanconi anemia, complementation group D2 n=1 Tax=Oryza sativa subsp. japonica TaxID=39947 RepID=Q69NX2_ORYSJ|nr:putative fanconi anemia, complementation group D2 [Oryza sativa Japonica Group]